MGPSCGAGDSSREGRSAYQVPGAVHQGEKTALHRGLQPHCWIELTPPSPPWREVRKCSVASAAHITFVPCCSKSPYQTAGGRLPGLPHVAKCGLGGARRTSGHDVTPQRAAHFAT